MKKLLLSTIILLGFTACHKADTEIPFDLDCNHTQEAREEYLYDASRVQVHYMYKKELDDTINVRIDNYEVERRLCELIAIKNWSNPLSDTIFNILNIRANYATVNQNCVAMYIPNGALPELNIMANKTGNAEMDALINQYSLSIDFAEVFSDETLYYICGDAFTNIIALSLLFEETEPVTRALPLYYNESVKDIELLTMGDDFVDYVFTERWRDANNIQVSRKWRIRVYDDYRVRLREITGNSLP